MLDLGKVDEIVTNVASATLKKAVISKVFSSRTADAYGDEALSVTIVVKDGTESRVTGAAAVDTIFGIGRDLRQAGDDRQPIVRFATDKELAALDDAEF